MSNLLWVYLYEPGTADPFIPESGECHCTILTGTRKIANHLFRINWTLWGNATLALIIGSFTRLLNMDGAIVCNCAFWHPLNLTKLPCSSTNRSQNGTKMGSCWLLCLCHQQEVGMNMDEHTFYTNHQSDSLDPSSRSGRNFPNIRYPCGPM